MLKRPFKKGVVAGLFAGGVLLGSAAFAGVHAATQSSSGNASASSAAAPSAAPKPSAPPPGLVRTRFGGNVSISITRTGHYEWTSPPVALQAAPQAFVTTYRIVGNAELASIDATPVRTGAGLLMKVSFDVASFSPGASFVLLGSEAQDHTEMP